MQQSRQAGFAARLTKPVDADRLLEENSGQCVVGSDQNDALCFYLITADCRLPTASYTQAILKPPTPVTTRTDRRILALS
jgi:hypothetical protein